MPDGRSTGHTVVVLFKIELHMEGGRLNYNLKKMSLIFSQGTLFLM